MKSKDFRVIFHSMYNLLDILEWDLIPTRPWNMMSLWFCWTQIIRQLSQMGIYACGSSRRTLPARSCTVGGGFLWSSAKCTHSYSSTRCILVEIPGSILASGASCAFRLPMGAKKSGWEPPGLRSFDTCRCCSEFITWALLSCDSSFLQHASVMFGVPKGLGAGVWE